MSQRYRIFLTILIALTLFLTGVIIFILLFRQTAVPTLAVGPAGKDAIVDYQKINDYIDGKIANIPPAKDGKDAVVDYKGITAYIDRKIAALPKPKDGVDGKDGLNGVAGKDGSSCTTIQSDSGATITCGDGSTSTITNGADGYIELRCNENKNRWEVRYSPDDNWSLLNNKATKCTGV